MRLMAGIAGQTTGVIGTGHLGEGVRLGRVGLVAAGANHGGIGQGRLDRSGIIGVPGLRAVANLTVQSGMPAPFLLIHYIGVTAFADFVTGVGDRACCHFSDGSAAVVSVLAEGFGNDSGTQDDERDERDQHDSGEPKKVFDVLEQNLTLACERHV